MSETETGEVRRLRERVAQLELELAAGPRPPAPDVPQHRRVIWRTVASAILITLACLLAPLSATALWASRQVSDTEQYLKTVAPLADDPAVQTTISDAVTNEILAAIDIQGITDETLNAISQQGLPPRVAANLQALSGPLVSGVQSFIRDQVANFVASPEAVSWRRVGRVFQLEVQVPVGSTAEVHVPSAAASDVTAVPAPFAGEPVFADGYTVYTVSTGHWSFTSRTS